MLDIGIGDDGEVNKSIARGGWAEGECIVVVAAGVVGILVEMSGASVSFRGCSRDEFFEGFFHSVNNDGAEKNVGVGGQYLLGG